MIKRLVTFLLIALIFSAVETKDLTFPLRANISDRFVGTVYRNDLINADDIHKLPQEI